MRKLLIANRGEIACRIIQTARRLGINTVAVYCDAEQNGKHVQLADEAYRLGPPPASTSYLQKSRLVEIAKSCSAQAIHPGYGFLSENAEFADLCASNGIEFVGPPASAISSMGSKSESKNIMIAAGVPVVPGYLGNQDLAVLQAEADKIGYPVLIKAAMGGGGRGMKMVTSSSEFASQLESAKREATKYFDDDEVILEKFVQKSRHVEIQVFADKHGNYVYLSERDCSMQRRNQKILEEAPAPGLSPQMRTRMGEVAVAAARAVKYVGAGTVEFLYDPISQEFYFMEMNTRLQVEHPVTEMVTGIDLVELQVKVANGDKLPFTQDEINNRLNGCCVEVRIYAENTEQGFLPVTGKLQYVKLPPNCVEGGTIDVSTAGVNSVVRVDSGFRTGDEVLVHYDSMIAKLIVWAKDRDTAIQHLNNALHQYTIVGVPTNIEFLKRAIRHNEFKDYTLLGTHFIESNREELLATTPTTGLEYSLACIALMMAEWHTSLFFSDGIHHPTIGGNRVNLPATHNFYFEQNEKPYTCVATYHDHTNTWSFSDLMGTFSSSAQLITQPTHHQTVGTACAFIPENSQRVTFDYVVTQNDVTVVTNGRTISIKRNTVPDSFGSTDAAAGGNSVVAAMPGKVIKVNVKQGDVVNQGDVLGIMEAMKMEHSIKATCSGTIEKLLMTVGEMVGNKKLLAVIEPQE